MKTSHYKTTKKAVLLTALCLFTLSPLFAQDDDGKKEGTVTVNQSQEINDLVFGKEKKQSQAAPTKKPEERQTPSKSVNDAPSIPGTPMPKPSTTTSASRPTPNPSVSEGETAGTAHSSGIDSGRKVMRRGRKMQGYRVQVFAGGNRREDRVKAQETGKRVKAAFPNQPVYTHFHSPRWTCRFGNFRKFETAERIVKQARNAGFHQACIVSEKITVQDR
ncbi:MAG: SPOR domain-containing protein [Prevotella sp.]|nr:SPOR domain-containing protein [Prevotella sp.]